MEEIVFSTQPKDLNKMLLLISEGKHVLCPTCHEKVFLVSKGSNPLKGEDLHPGMYCHNKCTRILIEFSDEYFERLRREDTSEG